MFLSQENEALLQSLQILSNSANFVCKRTSKCIGWLGSGNIWHLQAGVMEPETVSVAKKEGWVSSGRSPSFVI
jgi:hypothetical protein